MKTRYFLSDRYCENRDELFLTKGDYRHIDGSFCCVQGSPYESYYITKVEEMELSDFIADGRTKYELNGIRFVVDSVYKNKCEIKIKTDEPCCIVELSGNEPLFVKNTKPSWREWILTSRENDTSKHYHSHIEDIKLVTTCGQCGKDEVQDNGLCSDCISKLPKIESRKVVDIHQNENGSFSVRGVVNVCEHDEIVYTCSQYVEAIEKEMPDAVNHPSHYTGSGIECIEAIKASMTPDALAGYLKGNVQKYLWRYEKKVNPVEDLKKARWYLDYLINELDKENV